MTNTIKALLLTICIFVIAVGLILSIVIWKEFVLYSLFVAVLVGFLYMIFRMIKRYLDNM